MPDQAPPPFPAEKASATHAASAGVKLHEGYIDFYGYHPPSGGWYFVGWVRLPSLPPRHTDLSLTATFQLGPIAGTPTSIFHVRADLQGTGFGIVFFLPGTGRFQGPLTAIEYAADSFKVLLPATDTAHHYRDHELSGRVRSVLGTAIGNHRDRLLNQLARQGYAGHDTLAALPSPVFMDFDEAIFCPPAGLVLMGWMLEKPGTVQTVRLRSGDTVTDLPLRGLVPVNRPDVVEAIGRPYGLTLEQNGFVTYATPYNPQELSYLEIETTAGQIAFKGFPTPKLTGLPAIRRILDAFEVQYVAIDRAFDAVIGPAVASLNAERNAPPVSVDVLSFGAAPVAPRASIIIPLYGRIDFLEVQLALYAAHQANAGIEFLYVLDDPPKRRELEILAESVWHRFRMPFTLLLLDRNVGFAPASNIGLHHATGDYICFLNSDVFPGTPDWIDRLIARLHADPTLGCVGPLLQYEDGSIQHAGMHFHPLPQFGNWMFPMHTRKGWRSPNDCDLITADAITGAAMMMPRLVAESLGGFDETYVVGDFEDTDLCLKIHAAGKHCAVDPTVRLYHLERQSQSTPDHRWRQNLTLYNAWRHQRRWSDGLAALATASIASA